MTDEAKKGDILEVISEVFGVLRKLRKFKIGEKLLKNPFLFLQFTKNAQKAIFWSRIQTFSETMLALLANISEPIPKLLGHPVRT